MKRLIDTKTSATTIRVNSQAEQAFGRGLRLVCGKLVSILIVLFIGSGVVLGNNPVLPIKSINDKNTEKSPQNISVEIAGNGLDDDGDNLIDCHDPDVSSCSCTTSSTVSFQVTGQNTSAGFIQKYILTDSFGLIKQILNTPSVTGLVDGKYRIYSVNYDSTSSVTGLTVGLNISSVTGTCLNISLPLIYKVCLPPSVEIAGNGIDDDGDNLIDCHDPDVSSCSCTTSSTVSFQVTGQNTSAGFIQKYILTDSFGLIKQIVSTPSVTGLVDGKYRIYSVNYDLTHGVTGLVVGLNISGVTGTCLNISLPLIYKVCLPAAVEIAGNGLDDDGDNLIDCHDPDVSSCSCTTSSTVSFQVLGQNTSAGFIQKYILTDSFGLIKQIVSTPSVSSLIDGKYRIYSVNYDSTHGVMGLTVGLHISGVTGTCFNISLPLIYKVCLPPSVEIAGNGLDDDGDNLIDCHDSDIAACTCTTSSTVSFQVSGQNTSAGFIQKYILTDSFGLIKQIVSTPSVTGLVDGKYRIYSVNYDSTSSVTGLVVGSNISGVTGTCLNISLPLLYKICLPDCPTISSISKTNPSLAACPTPNDGQITVIAAGFNLRYSKDNGAIWQVSNTFKGLNGGSISLKVQDSVSLCAVDTTVVLVNPTCNQSPIAQNDTIFTLQNTPTNGSLALNDTDAEGGILSYTVLLNPQHGSILLSPSGTYTYTPSLGYVGRDTLSYQVCDNGVPSLCDTAWAYISVTDTACVVLDLKVLLEGAFNTSTGKMKTVLNQRGLLPGQTPVGQFGVATPLGQPFKNAPWNYNGIESVAHYAPTVVDWVLVSVRTNNTSVSSTVFKTAALLHDDGHIELVGQCFEPPVASTFFVVIEHRNHLGVMSPIALNVVNDTLHCDFTALNSFILSNPPSFGQKLLGGKWVMFAGDGKKNTGITNYDINFNDSQLWKLESGVFDQYRYGDFNLDADVNYLDQTLWKTNNGKYSGVPH